MSACPEGYFINSTIRECQSCALGCRICTSSSQYACSFWLEGFFMSSRDGYCTAGCPPDQYSDTNARTCSDCQPPCLMCSLPNDKSCTSCISGYLLYKAMCVTQCPIKLLSRSSWQCLIFPGTSLPAKDHVKFQIDSEKRPKDHLYRVQLRYHLLHPSTV